MRSDLAKLVTEAPRRGRAYAQAKKYGGKVHIVHDLEHDYLDEKGGFHSSARRRHHNHKEFSDTLNPLYGAIRKNVGRPWDDVYSEFCQFLDRRGVSGYHIFTHLMQEVAVHTYIDRDGRVCENPKYGYAGPVIGYYVHPLTGILCCTKGYGRRGYGRYHKKVDLTKLDSPHGQNSKYELRDGLWFHIFTEVIDESYYQEKERPIYSFYQDTAGSAKRYFDAEGRYYEWVVRVKEIEHKRSCSKKEIRTIRAKLREKVEEHDRILSGSGRSSRRNRNRRDSGRRLVRA